MSRRQVENVDQGRIFVRGVVEVSDLAGAAVRIRGADQLPEPVVSVVAHQQNRPADTTGLERVLVPVLVAVARDHDDDRGR